MADSLENNNSSSLSDYSDTETCSSSCCTDSDGEQLPWLEFVGPKGDLFYIESNISPPRVQEGPSCTITNLENQQPRRQSNLKLNTAEKLKKWMKLRKKKVRKSFPLLKSNKPDEAAASDLELYNAQMPKNVVIEVDSSQQTFGHRSTLAEELFGLVLGLEEDEYEMAMESKIKVLGFVSGQEDFGIKIGDWLKCINDITVNGSNIDAVLRTLAVPSKVKLTLLSPFDAVVKDQNNSEQSPSIMIKELLGDLDAIAQARTQFLHVPHGLYYLSVDSEFSESDYVVYKYPDENTSLFHLKGMFVTLSHMISDVEMSPPLLSCSVGIQDEIVHVGFYKEGNEIMILALPNSCATVSEVQHFTVGLSKLLKFQFLTLKKAFTEGNEETRFNHFLTLFFKHYLSSRRCGQRKFSSPHLLEILPSIHWLPLPADLKTEVDDILSELESSDFGSSSDGFYGNRRIYSILGSCLFYKGYLLSSHLQKNDLLDIHLFLQSHHILNLTRTQSVSQIIVWLEVFPTRYQETSYSDPLFQEVQGRWFLLIIAMNHSVLAVILEDGGCSSKDEDFPAPEPFYVEEVQNTLIILQDCGIIAAIEKMLHFCLPPVASPDFFLKENSSTRNLLSSIFSGSSNNHSSGSSTGSPCHVVSQSSLLLDKAANKISEDSVAERSDDVEAERQHLLSSVGPADGESDIESSCSEESSGNLSQQEKRLRRYSASTGSTTESRESSEHLNLQCQLPRKHFTSNPNINLMYASWENNYFEKDYRLLSGCGNTLFHYLHMDPVEGIFLAPIRDERPSIPGSAVKDILDSFYRCCLSMRMVFARSLRNENIMKSCVVPTYGINAFMQTVYEQGVLFQYNQKDATKHKTSHSSLNFWVIGRLFFTPEPREVYVCYHDSTQQDLVEMAFRLGFGLSF